MILSIVKAIAPTVVERVVKALADAPFVDGSATAGWHAKLVKKNQQLDARDPRQKELSSIIAAAVTKNASFRLGVRPKALQTFRFSRYEQGMGYGPHVDDALMHGHRSDVSMTLFLSAPESYDGGELVIDTGGAERSFKLAAGDMVTYPSTTLHRVEPVTRGVRLAAVSWAQSYVRDDARRELLYELDRARRDLFKKHGKTPEFDALSKAFSNLVRMWSDT